MGGIVPAPPRSMKRVMNYLLSMHRVQGNVLEFLDWSGFIVIYNEWMTLIYHVFIVIDDKSGHYRYIWSFCGLKEDSHTKNMQEKHARINTSSFLRRRKHASTPKSSSLDWDFLKSTIQLLGTPIYGNPRLNTPRPSKAPAPMAAMFNDILDGGSSKGPRGPVVGGTGNKKQHDTLRENTSINEKSII